MKYRKILLIFIAMLLVAIPAMADYPDPTFTLTTDKLCNQPGEEIKVTLEADGNANINGCVDKYCEWQAIYIYIENSDFEIINPIDWCVTMLPQTDGVIWIGCPEENLNNRALTATFKIKDTIPRGTVANVEAKGQFRVNLQPPNGDLYYTKDESDSKTISICETTDVPEYPSMFLPATMIIGFLGAVLLIQRTRKQ